MANLKGTGSADTLTGNDAKDSVEGNGGRDVLTGNGGDDSMLGGGGNDIMSGGTGDDVMIGSKGAATKTDMTNFKIHENVTAKITFDGETAGFKNALGMYKIGADGSMYDTKIVFANASLVGSGGNLVAGKSAAMFDLKAGERVGFFVVPNAYDQKGMDKLLTDTNGSWKLVDLATGKDGNVNAGATKLVHVGANGKETDIKSQYGVDMFHSTGDAKLNRDGYDHVKGQGDIMDGKVKIGFEDLWKGGDKDFDDSIFTVDIGINNARKLSTEDGPSARWQDDDKMDGGEGRDTMYGVSGKDTMDGGAGNDRMAGGSGDDRMTGGDGDDLVMGNSGNDTLVGDAGNDRIYGGSGFDTVDFSGATGGMAINLNAHTATGMGNDWLDGVERVIGSAHADTMDGDKRANTLEGGAGDDVLRGRGGADVLTGGNGDDTFVWHAKDLGAADQITDFAVGDVIDLSRLFKGVAGNHADLVTMTDTDAGMRVSVRMGDAMVDVVTLTGVHDTTAADLLKSGALLV
jgi:serralysin